MMTTQGQGNRCSNLNRCWAELPLGGSSEPLLRRGWGKEGEWGHQWLGIWSCSLTFASLCLYLLIWLKKNSKARRHMGKPVGLKPSTLRPAGPWRPARAAGRTCVYTDGTRQISAIWKASAYTVFCLLLPSPQRKTGFSITGRFPSCQNKVRAQPRRGRIIWLKQRSRTSRFRHNWRGVLAWTGWSLLLKTAVGLSVIKHFSLVGYLVMGICFLTQIRVSF